MRRSPSLCVVLGLLAIIACVALIAYECGRHHRSPAEMAAAASERTRRDVRVIFHTTNPQGLP